MTTLELIEQARSCATEHDDDKCFKCHFRAEKEKFNCVDSLINALADRLEVAYNDLKLGSSDNVCCICSADKCEMYPDGSCTFKWRGDQND